MCGGEARVAASLLLMIAFAPATVAAQTPAPPEHYPWWGIMVIGPKREDPRGPLISAGWVYHSVVRNGAIATVTFSERQGDREAALWRGVQATTLVGNRGFELGLGVGQYKLTLKGWGYELRAVAGRPWTASSGLDAGQWYAGGEAAIMWLFFRGSVGFVTPIGSVDHKLVPTASVGFVVLFASRPK